MCSDAPQPRLRVSSGWSAGIQLGLLPLLDGFLPHALRPSDQSRYVHGGRFCIDISISIRTYADFYTDTHTVVFPYTCTMAHDRLRGLVIRIQNNACAYIYKHISSHYTYAHTHTKPETPSSWPCTPYTTPLSPSSSLPPFSPHTRTRGTMPRPGRRPLKANATGSVRPGAPLHTREKRGARTVRISCIYNPNIAECAISACTYLITTGKHIQRHV